MTTTALPPAARQYIRPTTAPAPVDLATLSDWELRVVFYAIDYTKTWDEYRCGVDIVRLTTEATTFANRLGIDAIRDIAALIEYAWHTHDTTISSRFVPDRNRLGHTQSVLNGYRRWSTARRPLNVGTVAALSTRWTQATTPAVAV